MTSSASSVNSLLAEYAAGRLPAERLVSAVAAAYYGEGGRGKGEALRPIIDVIERAHPGVVELSGSADKPGFAVRLAERPFPKAYETQLRNAVAGVVTTAPNSAVATPGFFTRILRAIRRVFRAA